MKIKPLLGILILSGLLAALLVTRDASKKLRLPGARPANLVISSNFSYGMSGQESSAVISEKESYTQRSVRGVGQKTAFTVTPTEIDALYDILKKNRFDRLTSSVVEVNDGGSGSILVDWGANSIKVDMGDQYLMDEASEKNVNNINRAIADLVTQKISALYIPLTIYANQSIKDPAQLYVSLDDSANLFSNVSPATKQTTTDILPGDHLLNVTLHTVKSGTPAEINLIKKITLPSKATALTIYQDKYGLGYIIK